MWQRKTSHAVLDAIRCREHKFWYNSFTVASYDRFQVLLVDTNNQVRAEESVVWKAMYWLLKNSHVKKLMLNYWRSLELKKLIMPGRRFFKLESPIKFIQDNQLFLYRDMIIRTIYECIQFVRQLQAESGREESVHEGTVVPLAPSEPLHPTFLSCFSDNVTNTVGIYRQKLYQKTFPSFLPTVYNWMISWSKHLLKFGILNIWASNS